MSVNYASKIKIDDSRVTLQIVVLVTDDNRGIIYDCNMFIEQAIGYEFMSGISRNIKLRMRQNKVLKLLHQSS
jgi:hypothetical protein